MKRTIAPKPTWYRHTQFRSQLEAKWAMFFDELRIAWIYEPEKYTLTAGTTYLPDFWLPGFGSWWSRSKFFVEVKPEGLHSNKAIEFARQYHYQILVAVGEPNAGPYDHFSYRGDDFYHDHAAFLPDRLPGGGSASDYRVESDVYPDYITHVYGCDNAVLRGIEAIRSSFPRKSSKRVAFEKYARERDEQDRKVRALVAAHSNRVRSDRGSR